MASRGRQNITGKFYKGDEDFLCFSCGRQAGKKMCSLSLPSFNSQLYKIHDSNSIKICFGRAPMLYRIYSRSWRGIEVIWGPYYPPIHGHGFNRTRQLVVVYCFSFPQKWSGRAGAPSGLSRNVSAPSLQARAGQGRKETEHTMLRMDEQNELAHRPHHKQTTSHVYTHKPRLASKVY